jgi:hypothetical protein
VVTLYSDIVGFTSICSHSQPIEIISMLKDIYTEFDKFCGLLDIYTIDIFKVIFFMWIKA